MFFPKFMGQGACFGAVRSQNPPDEQVMRSVRLWAAVHEMLCWMESEEELLSIRLTTTVTLWDLAPDCGVRVHHHVKLSCSHERAKGWDADGFAIDFLPISQMGEGTFELSRSDGVVQEFLALVRAQDADVLAYRALVAKIALHMDAAFTNFDVMHDVGLMPLA